MMSQNTHKHYPIHIIHYHLLTGGVTSIVNSQLKSLKKDHSYDIQVICGHCPEPEFYEKEGIKVKECDCINYLDEGVERDKVLEIYQRIKDFLWKCTKGTGILHAHNLNLGKNPILTYVLRELAWEGMPVVNHVHDLAEDRPDRMKFLKYIIEDSLGSELHRIMYPDMDNYLFVTLNEHDRRRIMDQGISGRHVIRIPNPVDKLNNDNEYDTQTARSEIQKELGLDRSKKIVVYPVRVIRRKNIGEYILLAVLFRCEAEWLVTQPPKNPVEIAPYELWTSFCEEQGIPVIFEAGNKVDFEKLLHAADLCMTTSIHEGFGLVFLEPWLYHTPVAGRSIPEVIPDLKDEGMIFSALYESITVDLEGEKRDFARLDTSNQMKLISLVKKNKKMAKEILRQNPHLQNILEKQGDEIIRKNIGTIKKNYSITKNKERLDGLYRKISG